MMLFLIFMILCALMAGSYVSGYVLGGDKVMQMADEVIEEIIRERLKETLKEKGTNEKK